MGSTPGGILSDDQMIFDCQSPDMANNQSMLLVATQPSQGSASGGSGCTTLPPASELLSSSFTSSPYHHPIPPTCGGRYYGNNSGGGQTADFPLSPFYGGSSVQQQQRQVFTQCQSPPQVQHPPLPAIQPPMNFSLPSFYDEGMMRKQPTSSPCMTPMTPRSLPPPSPYVASNGTATMSQQALTEPTTPAGISTPFLSYLGSSSNSDSSAGRNSSSTTPNFSNMAGAATAKGRRQSDYSLGHAPQQQQKVAPNAYAISGQPLPASGRQCQPRQQQPQQLRLPFIADQSYPLNNMEDEQLSAPSLYEKVAVPQRQKRNRANITATTPTQYPIYFDTLNSPPSSTNLLPGVAPAVSGEEGPTVKEHLRQQQEAKRRHQQQELTTPRGHQQKKQPHGGRIPTKAATGYNTLPASNHHHQTSSAQQGTIALPQHQLINKSAQHQHPFHSSATSKQSYSGGVVPGAYGAAGSNATTTTMGSAMSMLPCTTLAAIDSETFHGQNVATLIATDPHSALSSATTRKRGKKRTNLATESDSLSSLSTSELMLSPTRFNSKQYPATSASSSIATSPSGRVTTALPPSENEKEENDILSSIIASVASGASGSLRAPNCSRQGSPPLEPCFFEPITPVKTPQKVARGGGNKAFSPAKSQLVGFAEVDVGGTRSGGLPTTPSQSYTRIRLQNPPPISPTAATIHVLRTDQSLTTVRDLVKSPLLLQSPLKSMRNVNVTYHSSTPTTVQPVMNATTSYSVGTRPIPQQLGSLPPSQPPANRPKGGVKKQKQKKAASRGDDRAASNDIPTSQHLQAKTAMGQKASDGYAGVSSILPKQHNMQLGHFNGSRECSILPGTAANISHLPEQQKLPQSTGPSSIYCTGEEEFRRYSIKNYHLHRTMKALVYKNAALCDELARLRQRIVTVGEDRKVLAKQLQHHERNRIRRIQAQRRKAESLAKNKVENFLQMHSQDPMLEDQMLVDGVKEEQDETTDSPNNTFNNGGPLSPSLADDIKNHASDESLLEKKIPIYPISHL